MNLRFLGKNVATRFIRTKPTRPIFRAKIDSFVGKNVTYNLKKRFRRKNCRFRKNNAVSEKMRGPGRKTFGSKKCAVPEISRVPEKALPPGSGEGK